ncbi:MAG: PKD domain-containing protein, partial [Bacteroidia bacterium]|nr:PKD domain-containing protein [Bacteroidia bacterium]
TGKIYRINLGPTLTGYQSRSLLNTTLPLAGILRASLCLVRDNSNTYLFANTKGNSSTSYFRILRFTFQNNCSANIPQTTVTNPLGITYSQSGTYYISQTILTNGWATSVAFDSIQVQPGPNVQFSSTFSCAGEPTSFTNQTTIQSGSITGYVWNLGDGTQSTQTNVTHTYANPGPIYVTLTATGSNNCSASLTDTIQVGIVPTAVFSVQTSCERTPVPLTDQSTAGTDSIVTRIWIPGTGDTIVTNQPTVNYTFNTTGTFTIKLIVITNNGCRDTTTRTIQIISRPQTQFVTRHTCLGQATQFINQTQFPGTLNYAWDFGDPASGNNSSNQTNPSHVFSGLGSYTVQLIATANNGCSDTLTQTVKVTTPSTASFTAPTSICQNEILSLQNLTTPSANTDTVYYIWKFGNGDTSTAVTPVYAYNSTNIGNYNLSLITINPTYCADTLTRVINVVPGPNVLFTANPVCQGQTTIFQNQTTFPPGQTGTYLWQFGDGDSSTFAGTVGHVYDTMGVYFATVTVTSNTGCVVFYTDTVFVRPLPIANFTLMEGCVADTVFLRDESTIASGSITGWEWNLNGNLNLAQNPYFLQTSPGTFPISLTAISNFGCRSIPKEDSIKIIGISYSFQDS